MGLQKGYKQRLYLGDGGKVTLNGTTIALDIASISSNGDDAIDGLKVVKSDGGFGDGTGAVKVGMRVDISGFVNNNLDLEGYVKAVADGEIELSNVYDSFGEQSTLFAEAEGPAVTLTFEEFHRISEEQTLTFNNPPVTEESGSKERKGQSRQSILSYSLDFQCAGKADFPDTNGLGRAKSAIRNVETVTCRIIENDLGHVWEAPCAITHSQNSSQTENIGYSVSGNSAGLVKYMEVDPSGLNL